MDNDKLKALTETFNHKKLRQTLVALELGYEVGVTIVEIFARLRDIEYEEPNLKNKEYLRSLEIDDSSSFNGYVVKLKGKDSDEKDIFLFAIGEMNKQKIVRFVQKDDYYISDILTILMLETDFDLNFDIEEKISENIYEVKMGEREFKKNIRTIKNKFIDMF